ncbi:MAG: DUF1566 domain-containing protein [Deltaproteobacteria bacterium]
MFLYIEPCAAANVKVTNVRYAQKQTYYSFIVDLSAFATITSSKSPDSKKLFIHIKNASISKNVKKTIQINEGTIKTVAIYQYKHNMLRIMFSMENSEFEYRTYMLRNPVRFVINIYPGKYPEEKILPKAKPSIKQKAAGQKPAEIKQQRQEDEKRRIQEAEWTKRLALTRKEIEQAEQKKKTIEQEIAQLKMVYTNLKKTIETDADIETIRERFIIRNDGTIIDKATKRMWLQNANYPMRGMNWEEAVKYCEDLNYAGYNDWRVPSRREWEVLIGNKGINKTFPQGHPFENIVVPASYWTSTPNPPGHVFTYSVNVESGSIESLKKERIGYVWPVRYATEADLAEDKR